MSESPPRGMAPIPSSSNADHGLLPVFMASGLMDATLVANLIEHEITSLTARLRDYRRVDLPDAEWALLEPAAGESSEGSVVLIGSLEDLRRLDSYRGVGEGLYRRTLGVAWIEGRPSPCPVYLYLPTERTLRRFRSR